METTESHKPFWICVRIDETGFWKIAPEDKPFVEKIYGVYVYDSKSQTHLCEITPSYFMHFVSHVVDSSAFASDAVRERLNEDYEMERGEDIYMHVAVVDRISAENKHVYGENKEDETIDDVIEHYSANPAF